MTHPDKPKAVEAREMVARIIDPALASQHDSGHLNAWGHENWAAVLMKADQIIAALSAAGGREWRPTHRHVKRGTVYKLVSSAVLQTEKPVGDNKFLALYQGEDGLYWVRPADEFTDGRFEELPPTGAPS